MAALLLGTVLTRHAIGQQPQLSEQPYNVAVILSGTPSAAVDRALLRGLSASVARRITNALAPLVNVTVKLRDEAWRKNLSDTEAEQYQLRLTNQELDGLKVIATFSKLFVFELDYEERPPCFILRWQRMEVAPRHFGRRMEVKTPHQTMIGRNIYTAICQDFAPIAEIVSFPVQTPRADERATVRVQFQGSKWPQQLSRLLRQKCILQPYVLGRNSASPTFLPVKYTLLEVQEARQKGFTAEVISKRQDPWSNYRNMGKPVFAIQVTTHSGPLRIQLIAAQQDQKQDRPDQRSLRGGTVLADDKGFVTSRPRNPEQRATVDENGSAHLAHSFDHVAYVTIRVNGREFQLPVPITSMQMTDEIVPISTAGGAEVDFEFSLLIDHLRDQFVFLGQLHDRYVNEINVANRNEDFGVCVTKTQQLIDMIKEIEPWQQRLDEVQQAVESDEIALTPVMLRQRDSARVEMENWQAKLKSLKTMQEDFEQVKETKEKDARAQAEIDIAVHNESIGNGDEAIKAYQRALRYRDSDEIQNRLRRLQQIWDQNSERQLNARHIIYQDWPSATLTELRSLLPAVREAYQIRRDMGDYLSAQKLQIHNNMHIRAVTESIRSFAQQVDEEAVREFQDYLNLVQEISAWNGEILVDVRKMRPPAENDAPR